MRNIDLLQALNKIDEKYLIEAENCAAESEKLFEEETTVMGVDVMKKTSIWKKAAPFAAFAAALTLVVGTAVYADRRNNPLNPESSTVPIDEIYIGNAEVIDILSDTDNITHAESFEIVIPENLDHISTFTYGWGKEQSNKDFYESYLELFEYLFPHKQINKDILRYYGENSKPEYDDDGTFLHNMNTVNSHYEDIINGKEDVLYFYYDEAAEFGADHTKNYVCALFANPICGNFSNFNKGKTANITKTDMYLETFQPASYFVKIASHSPESEEVYRLADKEISIKDAVDFYENYINNLPFPSVKTDSMKMCVVSVDVFRVSDDMYGYGYHVAREYEGIPFDYRREGTSYSADYGYDIDMSSGFMIESNDVDKAYGIYLRGTADNKKEYTNIISFENAVKTVSKSLTQDVEFRLEKAELVYCQKSADQSKPVNEIFQETAPAWKFTLFNPNDSRSYICYIDAHNGENFRYYTIRKSVEEE